MINFTNTKLEKLLNMLNFKDSEIESLRISKDNKKMSFEYCIYTSNVEILDQLPKEVNESFVDSVYLNSESTILFIELN